METAGVRSTDEGIEGASFNAARFVVNAPASLSQPDAGRGFDVHVDNARMVPARGGAILAVNQLAGLDPAVLSELLGRRVVVPATLDGSLYDARRALECGELVVLFPEGRRARSRRHGPGHSGVAHLALATGAPIIPIGIVVADAVPSIDARTPRRSTMGVRFGSPIHPGSLGERPTMRTRLALTNDVMQAISALAGVDATGRPNHLVQGVLG